MAVTVDVSFSVGETGLVSWHPSSIPLEGGGSNPPTHPFFRVTQWQVSMESTALNRPCQYVDLVVGSGHILTGHETHHEAAENQQAGIFLLRLRSGQLCHGFSCRLGLRMVLVTCVLQNYKNWPFQFMIQLPPWALFRLLLLQFISEGWFRFLGFACLHPSQATNIASLRIRASVFWICPRICYKFLLSPQ